SWPRTHRSRTSRRSSGTRTRPRRSATTHGGSRQRGSGGSTSRTEVARRRLPRPSAGRLRQRLVLDFGTKIWSQSRYPQPRPSTKDLEEGGVSLTADPVHGLSAEQYDGLPAWPGATSSASSSFACCRVSIRRCHVTRNAVC